jgi:hypothetical protein
MNLQPFKGIPLHNLLWLAIMAFQGVLFYIIFHNLLWLAIMAFQGVLFYIDHLLT